MSKLMGMVFGAILCVGLIAGCSIINGGSGNETTDTTNTEVVITQSDGDFELPIDESKGLSNVMAICIGLTAVNPTYYDGWAGDCPGCDVDAKGLGNLFIRNGIRTRLMLNSAANWYNVKNAIMKSANALQPNGLLIVAASGHGGQVSDNNGDETDGQDETWCLWDGQVRDDEVLKLIQMLPPNIRLVIINDQCHSEGNFRSVFRTIQQTVSFGYWGSIEAKPIIDSVGTRVVGAWQGQLIQYAGCRENSYSYGASSGGTWTQNLLKSFNPTLTWNSWFTNAKNTMPANQVPQFVTYGNIQSSFVDGTVLK